MDFVPEVEYPCIAAIEVAGGGVTRRSTAAGRPIRTTPPTPHPESRPATLPVDDFYADWAPRNSGREAGPAAADIFARLDGNFPQTSGWNRGPGVIVVNRQPWAKVAPRYAFVDEFAALRPRVRGERHAWSASIGG